MPSARRSAIHPSSITVPQAIEMARRLDDRLQISLLDQVRAQQVAVVLQVEIGDGLAGLGHLDASQELGLGDAGNCRAADRHAVAGI